MYWEKKIRLGPFGFIHPGRLHDHTVNCHTVALSQKDVKQQGLNGGLEHSSGKSVSQVHEMLHLQHIIPSGLDTPPKSQTDTAALYAASTPVKNGLVGPNTSIASDPLTHTLQLSDPVDCLFDCINFVKVETHPPLNR